MKLEENLLFRMIMHSNTYGFNFLAFLFNNYHTNSDDVIKFGRFSQMFVLIVGMCQDAKSSSSISVVLWTFIKFKRKLRQFFLRV